jgi:hypothetical protein
VVQAGRDGLLVEFQNEFMLAEAIILLLANPRWAQALGEARLPEGAGPLQLARDRPPFSRGLYHRPGGAAGPGQKTGWGQKRNLIADSSFAGLFRVAIIF